MKKTYWVILGIIIVLITILVILRETHYYSYMKYDKFNNSLINECSMVPQDNVQECCDNWAKKNRIVHIQCVGRWVIEDNQCKWECG